MGFTKVINYISSKIVKEFDLHFLGIGYSGNVLKKNGITIYPSDVGEFDFFYSNRIKFLINDIKPNMVLVVHDVFHQIKLLGLLKDIKTRNYLNFKIISYIAIDGNVTKEHLLKHFCGIDSLIFYTNFASDMIKSHINSSALLVAEKLPKTKIMPHGIDKKIFYPLININKTNRRRLIKNELFNIPSHEKSFIVLNANRLDPRKRIDLTLYGFAIFAKGKPPHVKLFIHEPEGSIALRTEVLKLAHELKIKDRIIMNESKGSKFAVSEKDLNLIYNACDVGINTCMGEGWGLTNFEHAATGAAQIVPRHTCFPEIWDTAAEMLIPDKRIEYYPYEMECINPQDLANSLEKLYSNKQYLHEMSIKAYERVTQPKYQWDNIAMQWRDFFLREMNYV